MDGTYAFSFEGASTGFTGKNTESVLQRLRLGMTMVASENLSGYAQFQLGTDAWGTRDYKHGTYGQSVAARQVYIDWTVPSTGIKVRMGRSCLGLPAEAFGTNSVMDAGWGVQDGVTVNVPVTDWLSLDALWVRAGSDGNTDVDTGNNADLLAIMAPMKFNGFSVTPYVAYASIDDGVAGAECVAGSGDGTLRVDPVGNLAGSVDIMASVVPHDSNVFWAGATAVLSYFDPFTLKLSFVYGSQNYEGAGAIVGGTGSNSAGGWAVDERKGWNVQAKASYELPFGTPVLGAWYASGDDADSKTMRDGWMPSVTGRFVATQDFHDGAYGLGGGVCTYNIAGTWGAQIGIEQVSFLQNLTHDFKVTYIQGTNNVAWINSMKDFASSGRVVVDVNNLGAYKGPHSYMTTSDSLVEVSLSNTFKIYKNLEANLELAYIFNNFDEDLYTINGQKNFTEDDWRVALCFQYKF